MTTTIWDAHARSYDDTRRRLIPCFDAFYGTAGELIARTIKPQPKVLDLGAGTGLLSQQVLAKVEVGELVVQDGSADMLALAEQRLAGHQPKAVVSDLSGPLPAGRFDVIMSALAIHHLEDAQKEDLFARIYAALAPGGIFVNAEQVQGETLREQALFERLHIDTARQLGSSETEIAGALERMKLDRCAPVVAQVNWLREVGFVEAGIFFQWFRFAVYAGWKAPLAR